MNKEQETASMFMADKADAGHTSMVTAASAEGLVRV